jgi:hypothetical protein
MSTERPLWQLLSEDPSKLTCDECFAVIEYYADVLATVGPDLLPKVLAHLRSCPTCRAQHREALRRLIESQSETNDESHPETRESDGRDQEE